MNRILQILNFLGILALVILCVFQWQANRSLNLHILDLESDHRHLSDQLEHERTTLEGTMVDLNDFRTRLAAAESAAKETDSKLAAAATQLQTLTAQRDQLRTAADTFKSTLDKWTAAVAARDAALKKAEATLQTLTDDSNAAITRFNDLALKYNAAGEDIKKANTVIQQLSRDRNDAVEKFNDLATKYNALQQSPATRP